MTFSVIYYRNHFGLSPKSHLTCKTTLKTICTQIRNKYVTCNNITCRLLWLTGDLVIQVQQVSCEGKPRLGLGFRGPNFGSNSFTVTTTTNLNRWMYIWTTGLDRQIQVPDSEDHIKFTRSIKYSSTYSILRTLTIIDNVLKLIRKTIFNY